MKQIVWTAVASVVFIIAATAYSLLGGTTEGTMALGSAAIATAILATREK